MFWVQGDLVDDIAIKVQSTPFGFFAARASGNDAECLRLSNVTAFTLTNVLAGDFDNQTASGVFVFDGKCWNAQIDNVGFTAPFEDCSGADVFRLLAENSTEPPGELKFGTGVSTYSGIEVPFNTVLRMDDGARVTFNGRAEGASDALFKIDAGNLHMATAELGRVEGTDTDKIEFAGGNLTVGSGVYSKAGNDTGGNNITIREGHDIRIASWNDQPCDAEGGYSLSVEGSSGGPPWVVPRAEALTGAVNYPDGPWNSLRYSDGYQLYRSDTVTLESGGDVNLTSWGGKINQHVVGPHEGAGWQVTGAPGDQTGGHQPAFYWVCNERNQQRALRLRDEKGEDSSGSVDIYWEIERRGI
jgi:hypothetical protein